MDCIAAAVGKEQSRAVGEAGTAGERADAQTRAVLPERCGGAGASRRNSRARLPVRIARDIAGAILSGVYNPGDRLFGEIASSDRLNVSRAAYREAMRILAAQGFVSSKPRAGTVVNAKSKWHLLDPEVLGLLFEAAPHSSLLESLYELWHMVGPRAAAAAARRGCRQELFEMRECVERLKRNTLATENGRKAYRDFHVAVLVASGNPYVASLAAGLVTALEATARSASGGELPDRDPVPELSRIAEAIAGRDGNAAAQEMSSLIERATLEPNENARSELTPRDGE